MLHLHGLLGIVLVAGIATLTQSFVPSSPLLQGSSSSFCSRHSQLQASEIGGRRNIYDTRIPPPSGGQVEMLLKPDAGRGRTETSKSAVTTMPPPNSTAMKGVAGALRKAVQAVGRFNRGIAGYTSDSLGLSLGGMARVQHRPPVTCKEYKDKRKVLILMSDTGGGHRASAQALQAAFDMEFPGKIDVDIVDIWTEFARWPYNQFVPSYQFLAANPKFWKAFWEYGKFPVTRKLTEVTSNMICHGRFRSCIEKSNPDLVISVHPLCQNIPLLALKNMGGGSRNIPFVTVVTDLGGAHPTWFDPRVDKCFVPSEILRKNALARGLAPEQIKLYGLPTRPGFWRPVSTDKHALQTALGLRPGLKTCLVVGGGDGVGGLAKIAASVIDHAAVAADALGGAQVVVVCGKNDMVREELETRRLPPGVHVKVLGFVKNMDEWMGAVDVIITKAGPGTIAEATIRSLPIMLSTYLPGQEEGNIPYVTEGGFGAYSKDPKVIGETVTSWLLDDKKLKEMGEKARLAARPQATTAIARDIGRMLWTTTPVATESQQVA